MKKYVLVLCAVLAGCAEVHATEPENNIALCLRTANGPEILSITDQGFGAVYADWGGCRFPLTGDRSAWFSNGPSWRCSDGRAISWAQIAIYDDGESSDGIPVYDPEYAIWAVVDGEMVETYRLYECAR